METSINCHSERSEESQDLFESNIEMFRFAHNILEHTYNDESHRGGADGSFARWEVEKYKLNEESSSVKNCLSKE